MVSGLAPQLPVPLTTTYLYDGEDIVLQTVSDGTTTTATQFVHGPGIDEPLAMVRGGLMSRVKPGHRTITYLLHKLRGHITGGGMSRSL